MRYEELFSTFPELLREILEEWKLNRELLQEIRIRAGRPVLAVCRNREYQSVKTINRTEMKEILACLSNYSLYACEDELCQGFLSLPGGHGAGGKRHGEKTGRRQHRHKIPHMFHHFPGNPHAVLKGNDQKEEQNHVDHAETDVRYAPVLKYIRKMEQHRRRKGQDQDMEPKLLLSQKLL